MKKLTVVTTYRKRIKNFIRYARHINECKNNDIEFILISLGDDDIRVKTMCEEAGIIYHYEDYHDIFSNGMGHNIGAKIGTGKWLLKLDVDCIPYIGFFDKLLNYIDNTLKDKTDFLNIGCYFMKNHYRIESTLLKYNNFTNIKDNNITGYNNRKIGGMLYLCDREHYLDIGGTPDDFIGWGWEDYWVIYILMKKKQPSFKLSEIDINSPHVSVREEIARPIQQITNANNLVTIHLPHEKDLNSDFYRKQSDNRNILYNKIMEYENVSRNI